MKTKNRTTDFEMLQAAGAMVYTALRPSDDWMKEVAAQPLMAMVGGQETAEDLEIVRLCEEGDRLAAQIRKIYGRVGRHVQRRHEQLRNKIVR